MTSFKYNTNTTTTMTVSGCYDAERMTIDDGEGNVRDLRVLLSEFEGSVITFKAVIKSDEELDEPQLNE